MFFRSRQKSTVGGSMETEVKELTVSPMGTRPCPMAVTTLTPLGHCCIISLYAWGSMSNTSGQTASTEGDLPQPSPLGKNVPR